MPSVCLLVFFVFGSIDRADPRAAAGDFRVFGDPRSPSQTSRGASARSARRGLRLFIPETLTVPFLFDPSPQGRRDNSTKDEPFAFESREALRRTLIGRRVRFRVDHSVPSIGREFGQVYLGDENIALAHVAEGWAKVKPTRDGSADEELVLAERDAQARGVGVWTRNPTEAAAASRSAPAAFDARAFFAANRGAPVRAVVEAVFNGSCVRVCLLTDSSETRRASLVVHLAGVQCPNMGKRAAAEPSDGDGDAPRPETQPEPFAREAKHFTETRALHRDATLILEGEDKYHNLYATFSFDDAPNVDVAEELTRNGLARVADWSAALVAGGAARLRAAEKAAKASRARIWREYVPPPDNSISGGDFRAVVVEAVSGDVVVVAHLATGAERRVNLSSVRAPRLGNERRGQRPEPWAVEAKEFLRQRCVGREVLVKMEYIRKIGGGDGGGGEDASRVLEFGGVYLPGEKGSEKEGESLDVAEMLVLRGLASVTRHRGDEERSSRYDDLVAAEQRASKAKKGIQNRDKEAPTHHVNDISQNAQKARHFLPFLQRAGKSRGVVEYVVNGHRAKIHIPKESAVVSFSLAGVRCPQGPRGDAPGEPFAAEATRRARRRCMQRDVEIEVDTVDKTGAFLGRMWVVEPDGRRVDVGVETLREGLGSIHPMFIPERHSGGETLRDAQEAAKRARAGMWKDWSPEAEAAKAAEEEAAARRDAAAVGTGDDASRARETLALTLTEVVDGATFFAQRSDAADAVARLHAELQKRTPAATSGDAPPPSRGAVVAARFTGDDEWYRAAVCERAKPGAPVRVFYVDYGNVETLAADRLRPLDPSVSLAATPAAARLCRLTHLRAPGAAEEYGEESARALGAMAGGRSLLARVDRAGDAPREPWDAAAVPQFYVTLGTSKTPETSGEDSGEEDTAPPTVNERMAAEGLARLERGAAKRADARTLVEAQETARRERRHMWEYGDVESDDEEPRAGPKPGAWGRRR